MSLGLKVCPPCGLCARSLCSRALIAIGTSLGNTDPRLISCEDQVLLEQKAAAPRPNPHSRLTSVGLWCPLSPPCKCVTYGGGWIVIWHGLKLTTGCTGSGASREVQTKVNHYCALPRTTQYELQSNVQMATTCAQLGVSQKRPCFKPRLFAASARPEATQQEVWGYRGQMLLI